MQLATCTMHLAIEALESKKTAKARELALEAVSHAEAAKAADPTCAQVSDSPFDPRMMSASVYSLFPSFLPPSHLRRSDTPFPLAHPMCGLKRLDYQHVCYSAGVRVVRANHPDEGESGRWRNGTGAR